MNAISLDRITDCSAFEPGLDAAGRREWIFSQVRRSFRKFVDRDGIWQSPPAVKPHPDPRALVQVAIAYLHGDEADRKLAECLLLSDGVTQRLVGIPPCAFTKNYLIVLLIVAGRVLSDETREILKERATRNLLCYTSRDLRHHGYNDNHVTLATGALILGGEMSGNLEAVEQGRTNLLNFRDTFLRRGFMHETNDCYIPHTLYPIAAIAEWSQDAEIRQLARDCEARIWADWIGHWHVNLGRKPGPSARDYTGMRLQPLTYHTALWSIFGDSFGVPAYPPADSFAEKVPDERFFQFNGNPADGHWNLGFISFLCAHDYHVPEGLMALMYERNYPHIIRGTHEVGHLSENVTHVVRDTVYNLDRHASKLLPWAMPFSAREIFTYQYQERDWAMGTASQRMIGNCPNNNWSVVWRKTQRLERTRDQGLAFCSFTLNEKCCTGNHSFIIDPTLAPGQNKGEVEHWFDNGKYAAVQHERTSIMLYRPRVHDRHELSAIATSIVFPLCFKNHIDRMELGDQVIHDFKGESTELCDLFVQDGPLFIGIRPLIPVELPADVRVRVVREEFWGTVHFYSYRGPALDLEEIDLCRLGGGFVCEVATKDDFASLEAFKAWFRRGEVVDEQDFFMRHVRYHREGLDLGLRWDVWVDNIMHRTLNGRAYPTPVFECSGVDPEQLPWLTGDVSGLDHFSWAKKQSIRPEGKWPGRPLELRRAKAAEAAEEA
ncbi:MAG TPA: hypothetical protein VK985_12480 [Rariglobus sp.]|nr:hypothetical protein [Rariglobus sp.]